MNSFFSEMKTAAMKRAVELAALGRGRTAPNPMVGAVVISREGSIIGEGFHARAGGPHAEVVAIHDAQKRGHSLEGATLAVTLEPCNHTGKTPPCTDLILSSGIKNILVGAIDPNPLMKGRSLSKLRAAGVNVEESLLKDQCETLIRGFRSVLERKRPFVTLKCAASLDGKIATAGGESQWITEAPARQLGHAERGSHDTILVGVGTVLADNPQLNVRLGDRPHAITKVILDSHLRTPPESHIFDSADPVLIYCDWNYSQERKEKLERAGATIIPSGSPAGPFSLDSLHLTGVLEDLAKRKTQELLVEGGARVLGAFVRERVFDRVIYFIAPKIFGSESRDVFEGLQINKLKDTISLENLTTRLVGKDIVIEGTNSCLPV